MTGALYLGEVMHRRRFPVRYRFAYRVYSLLLDIDRIGETAARLRLLSHNRFNLLSFHDRDHGPRDGAPLRPWIDGELARRGIDLEGGRVRLLCFPRVLGYVFNPLSVWYCEHRDGGLRAVLCEVSNTFGEHHGYLLERGGERIDWPLREVAAKEFHVSPFLGMEAHYGFRIGPPGETLSVGIRVVEPAGPVLGAALVARRRPLSDREIAGAALRRPLLTLKVIGAIHYEALRIWLRGGPFHPKPAAPGR